RRGDSRPSAAISETCETVRSHWLQGSSGRRHWRARSRARRGRNQAPYEGIRKAPGDVAQVGAECAVGRRNRQRTNLRGRAAAAERGQGLKRQFLFALVAATLLAVS